MEPTGQFGWSAKHEFNTILRYATSTFCWLSYILLFKGVMVKCSEHFFLNFVNMDFKISGK